VSNVRPYHRYRGESSFTLPRLIAILKEQIPQIVPEQTRYRVSTIPTPRTIRFYTARGLVDKPTGREAQSALYGYRHLLQILAVKYLQANYLPLLKIRTLVGNATNRDLEQLMPDIAPATWLHRGITREAGRFADRPGLPSSPQTPPGAPGGAAAPAEAVRAQDVDVDAWHRLEVSPGIELHVHAAALSPEDRERLRGVLLREMGVLRGWFDAEEKH
jgi:DNA-binding transcriptional MerR regulator